MDTDKLNKLPKPENQSVKLIEQRLLVIKQQRVEWIKSNTMYIYNLLFNNNSIEYNGYIKDSIREERILLQALKELNNVKE